MCSERWIGSDSLPPPGTERTVSAGGVRSETKVTSPAGLVSPDLITHLLAWWKQHGTVFPEEALPSFFRASHPDYCIVFPSWYPNLTQAPWLQYLGEFDVKSSTGGGDRLVVYRVVGTPKGPDDKPGR